MNSTVNEGNGGSLDDFEVINQNDTFQNDRKLIVDQIVKLLKSEVITIEEKGSLIQLMHNKRLRSVVSDIMNDITSPK